jgi:2-iminobutanoate/2-iminopropanoate deaminase
MRRGSVEIIHTDDAPPHTGPVPQAVTAGGWIFVSALFGADATTHAIPEEAAAEAEVLFDNLTAILAAGGVGLRDVVRVGIVMRDLQADRPTFNKVWAERFGDHRRGRRSSRRSSVARVRTPGSWSK